MNQIVYTSEYQEWFDDLADRKAQARIVVRLQRIENGQFGVGINMNKKSGLKKFDVVDFLDSEANIAAYMNAVFDEAGDDPAFIAQSLGHIARARGMSKIAKETGLSRESLYRALSGQGNPEFGTILKIFKVLGIRLQTI